MKTKLKTLATLFLVVLFAGQLYAQVKSDYDKKADFTKYKTYTFKGWEKNSDKILNDFDKKRILEAFRDELDAREMTKDDNSPDVAITLYIVVDNKTSTTAYTNYNGGMGYGVGRWGWGMGMGGMASSTTTYSEDDYKQGTLVVSFYDESSKNLVWQGVLTKVVNEKPEKRDKSIPKNVKKLMKRYPVKPMK